MLFIRSGPFFLSLAITIYVAVAMVVTSILIRTVCMAMPVTVVVVIMRILITMPMAVMFVAMSRVAMAMAMIVIMPHIPAVSRKHRMVFSWRYFFSTKGQHYCQTPAFCPVELFVHHRVELLCIME